MLTDKKMNTICIPPTAFPHACPPPPTLARAMLAGQNEALFILI